MFLQDVLIPGISYSGLMAFFEEFPGVSHEIMIERVLTGDKGHQGFLSLSSNAARPLPSTRHRARIPATNAAVESADVYPQFEGACGDNAQQFAAEQPSFDLPSFLGQKPRPVRAYLFFQFGG